MTASAKAVATTGTSFSLRCITRTTTRSGVGCVARSPWIGSTKPRRVQDCWPRGAPCLRHAPAIRAFPTCARQIYSLKWGEIQVLPPGKLLLLQSSATFTAGTNGESAGSSIPDGGPNTSIMLRKPSLELDAKATDFFSKPEFFRGYEEARKNGMPVIEEKFKDMSVRQALLLFKTEAEVRDFCYNASIFESTWVLEYFRSLQRTDEEILTDEIVALNEYRQVNRIKAKYVALDWTDVLHIMPSDAERSLPVFLILGSSGSGKTFFAVKHAATVNIEDPKVTLYCQLTVGSEPDHWNKDPAALVSWIKKRIQEEKQRTMSFPLKMHVSVVIDEAGKPSLEEHFEKYDNLRAICRALEELATSTRLVVCGTGVHGRELSSKNDVRKVPMRQWTREDLEKILQFGFNMASNEAKSAVDAILRQQALKALSTNARSCHYMMESVNSAYTLAQKPIDWVDELNDRTPSIVDYVVKQYIQNNGLAEIQKKSDRFCVAASVFRAVEVGRNKIEESKFVELPYRLRHVALCLVDPNTERVDGFLHRVDEENPTVLVSPAIVMILCSLLGARATVLATWEAQQLITALYAFRERALSIFQPSAETSIAIQQQWADKMKCDVDQVHQNLPSNAEKTAFNAVVEGAYEGLASKIDRLVLVKLKRAVPATNASQVFLFPRLGKDAIWMNGNMGPFADVVAANTFYQCKHTILSSLTIDLEKELRKCGLLKTGSKPAGRIVLRALLQKWRRNSSDGLVKAPAMDDMGETEVRPKKQRSDAFPLNLLDASLKPPETTSYDEISLMEGSDNKWMINDLVELDDMPPNVGLRFVFSTNVDVVRLKIPDGGTIKLPVHDGKVDMEALERDSPAYGEYLKANVVDGVTIEFLITY